MMQGSTIDNFVAIIVWVMREACIDDVLGSVLVSVSILLEVPEAPGTLEGAGVDRDCVLDHFLGICFAYVKNVLTIFMPNEVPFWRPGDHFQGSGGPPKNTILNPKRDFDTENHFF